MKKFLIILLLILIPINVNALELKNVNASNYIVYDLTDNKILFSNNSKEVKTVASLTKILTVITAIENCNDLNKKVVITNNMLNTVPFDAYTVGIKVGEEYTLRELLLAVNMQSGADAANAVALTISNSLTDFAKLMNEEAKKIGLNDSYFSNAIGMDTGGNKSSAYEINEILKYSLNNKDFKDIYTTSDFILNTGLDITNNIGNLNNNLKGNGKIFGYKTGFTSSAGFCISSYFESNGHEYTMVSLNSLTSEEDKYPNYSVLVSIVNYITSNYDERVLVNKGDVVKTLNVVDASISEYKITIDEEIKKYLPRDYRSELVKVEYTGLDNLSDINKVGDNIGLVKVFYDNELIYSKDILLDINIKHTIPQLIRKYKIMYFIIGLFILWLFWFIFIRKPKKN